MNLIIGKDGYGAILVLTERSTNYVIIDKLPHGKNARQVAKAAVRLLFAYRIKGVLTITTDNGSEFAAHQEITKGLNGVIVYLQTLIVPGRKVWWNIPTSYLDKISPKALTSRSLPLNPCLRSNIN